MAHLIDTMAYTGLPPWHGLGNVLPPQQSLDIWLQAAGMDWTIEQSDVSPPMHCFTRRPWPEQLSPAMRVTFSYEAI